MLLGILSKVMRKRAKDEAVETLERHFKEAANEQSNACDAEKASASGLKKAVDAQNEVNKSTNKALETFVEREVKESARVVQVRMQGA